MPLQARLLMDALAGGIASRIQCALLSRNFKYTAAFMSHIDNSIRKTATNHCFREH
jgi:hypothetical protein